MALTIRPLIAADHPRWSVLWDGYLAFYETVLAPEQTELTWNRLQDPEFGMAGIVADLDGKVVGLAHYSFTHSTWSHSPDLYLEDLFVDPNARGQGVGKTLIMALSEIAKSEGSRRIYWETHRDNQTARRLYDSVGNLSEFVKYSRENL